MWWGARLLLDLIGYSTSPEDFEDITKKLPAAAEWLLSTPWWFPALMATALTVFLIWVSWPRAQQQGAGPASPSAAIDAQNADELPKSLMVSFEEPNYEAWDQVRELTLIRAACLWAEQEPVNHPIQMMPEAQPRYTMLIEACRGGELKAFVRYNTGEVHPVNDPDFGHFLRRDDLKKFAESRGEKPKFLFPEERYKQI